jgi:uncharacterized membrane protein YczE
MEYHSARGLYFGGTSFIINQVVIRTAAVTLFKVAVVVAVATVLVVAIVYLSPHICSTP